MKKGSVDILHMVAVGASGLIATIALSWAATTSANTTIIANEVNDHTTEISQVQTSVCIQNENIKNLAGALKAPFVSDPSCRR